MLRGTRTNNNPGRSGDKLSGLELRKDRSLLGLSSGLCSSLRSLLSLGARLRGVVHSRVRAHPTRRHRAVAIVRSCSGRVGLWGFLRGRGLGNENFRLGMGSGPTTQGFNFSFFRFTFTRRDSNEGIVRTIPTRFEECTKLDGCFLSQNSGNDLDLVIEARITKNIA